MTNNWNDGLLINRGSEGTKIQDDLYSNNRRGITIEASDYTLATTTTIANNIVGLQLLGDSLNTTFNWCTFRNNSQGIAISGIVSLVHAEHNYWGSDSGPIHATTNPAGKGDPISEKVTFEPWLDKNLNEHVRGEKGGEQESWGWIQIILTIILVILLIMLWVVVASPRIGS